MVKFFFGRLLLECCLFRFVCNLNCLTLLKTGGNVQKQTAHSTCSHWSIRGKKPRMDWSVRGYLPRIFQWEYFFFQLLLLSFMLIYTLLGPLNHIMTFKSSYNMFSLPIAICLENDHFEQFCELCMHIAVNRRVQKS